MKEKIKAYFKQDTDTTIDFIGRLFVLPVLALFYSIIFPFTLASNGLEEFSRLESTKAKLLGLGKLLLGVLIFGALMCLFTLIGRLI